MLKIKINDAISKMAEELLKSDKVDSDMVLSALEEGAYVVDPDLPMMSILNAGFSIGKEPGEPWAVHLESLDGVTYVYTANQDPTKLATELSKLW